MGWWRAGRLCAGLRVEVSSSPRDSEPQRLAPRLPAHRPVVQAPDPLEGGRSGPLNRRGRLVCSTSSFVGPGGNTNPGPRDAEQEMGQDQGSSAACRPGRPQAGLRRAPARCRHLSHRPGAFCNCIIIRHPAHAPCAICRHKPGATQRRESTLALAAAVIRYNSAEAKGGATGPRRRHTHARRLFGALRLAAAAGRWPLAATLRLLLGREAGVGKVLGHRLGGEVLAPHLVRRHKAHQGRVLLQPLRAAPGGHRGGGQAWRRAARGGAAGRRMGATRPRARARTCTAGRALRPALPVNAAGCVHARRPATPAHCRQRCKRRRWQHAPAAQSPSRA